MSQVFGIADAGIAVLPRDRDRRQRRLLPAPRLRGAVEWDLATEHERGPHLWGMLRVPG